MHTNKAVLDEAARSIRRTFIGSIAGSVGMMGVIGAAGAYGMPERLSAQSLSEALTTLHVKFSPMIERAVPAAARARTLAGDMPRSAAAVMPTPDDGAASPAPPPTVTPTPVVAPVAAPAEVAIAAPPVDTRTEPAKPLDAAIGHADLTAPPVETPAAATTASIPDAATISKPEVVETPQAPVVVAPDAPVAPTAPPEEVRNTVEVPKTVWVLLPHPKPPLSPAQRLDLHGKDYDKAERCLAQAIYFEARNEPARGQQAVAQVVLNRVFSPYYPKDVCSVVYQNAHRHLSCQFTFACDGKPEAIRERGAWARAQRIAKQTLDAQIWLPEVNKATHYHAAYVHPRWVRDMRVMVRYGLHTFYRPRNWGDGSKEHSWGHAVVASKKGRSS
jgi:hypothetical protein